MHVTTFLHKAFVGALPQVHADRLTALFAAVAALLRGGPLSLTGLGRALATTAKVKHAIKRMDRLLGNLHLWQEREDFYRVLARALIGQHRHPVILIDWSHADDRKRLFILRAALPLAGRAFPLLERAHHRENCPRLQRQFLRQLAALLPPHCQPIVVTDAGFGRPWFEQVRARQWFYVGRVRNREHFALPGTDTWHPCRWFYAGARATPQALGGFDLTRQRFATQVYRYRRAPQGRQFRSRLGHASRDSRSRQCARREQDPWLLVSNLPARRSTAKKVVRLYALRMRIEEGFRDLKSQRYGLALRYQGAQSAQRLNILLLIGALATYGLLVCGCCARKQGVACSYQANTERTRPVLSLFTLGRQWLLRGQAGAHTAWRLATVDLTRLVDAVELYG